MMHLRLPAKIVQVRNDDVRVGWPKLEGEKGTGTVLLGRRNDQDRALIAHRQVGLNPHQAGVWEVKIHRHCSREDAMGLSV